MKPRFRAAFTLTELLVVLALMALLAGLLLPALGQAKARARSLQCLNHLRQLGVATLIYADENREKVQVHFPAVTNQTWGSVLSRNQPRMAFNLFVCPGYPPKVFQDWRRIYGIRLDPPTGATSGEFDEILLVANIRSPSDYVHLTDTTSRGRGGIAAEQYFYFRVLSENEVHARHQGRANAFFLDGHVEAYQRYQLERLGILALYERDTVPGYF